MAQASMVATRVQALVMADGESGGLVAHDAAENEIVVAMDVSVLARAITDWLQSFYLAPGFQALETQTWSAPQKSVPVNQFVTAIGGGEAAILRLAIGSAVLNIQLGTSAETRSLALQLLDLATEIDRRAQQSKAP